MLIPVFVFQRPTSSYVQGESIGYSVLPSESSITLNVKRRVDGKTLVLDDSPSFGLLEGDFFIPSSYIIEASGENNIYGYWKTKTNKFHIFPEDECQDKIENIRLQDHYNSILSHESALGVRTLTDPWALPFNCPVLTADRKWFPIPCYEGQSTLINEEQAYYCDPLTYYAECIDILIDKNVKFITWHDLLDGWYGDADQTAVLIQFDIDAGLKSIRYVAQLLRDRGVRATAMIHQRAMHWYEYALTENDCKFFKTLEKEGWAIGYHNNSLTNLVGKQEVTEYSDNLLAHAWESFETEISVLKEDFNIRTFTHHGGNVINHAMGDAGVEDLVCVDKKFSPELWKKISSSFSDGGFYSRPVSLFEKCKQLSPGTHFFRNHPLKYGNYNLENTDAQPLGPRHKNHENNQEIKKQTDWFKNRFTGRNDRVLSYDTNNKPLSRCFIRSERFDYHVKKFRGRRRKSFLLDYPHVDGDPRVFWWRLLYSHAPKSGRLLNVGALPPAQKEETIAFLGEAVECIDMDIDSSREPMITADFVNWSYENEKRFDCVCVFGLPYFNDPKAVIDAVAKTMGNNGIGLLGFCADTHPKRGGLWQPNTRPVWRRGMTTDELLTVHGNLWSFSDESVKELFENCPGKVEIESFSHYWFVVMYQKHKC